MGNQRMIWRRTPTKRIFTKTSRTLAYPSVSRTRLVSVMAIHSEAILRKKVAGRKVSNIKDKQWWNRYSWTKPSRQNTQLGHHCRQIAAIASKSRVDWGSSWIKCLLTALHLRFKTFTMVTKDRVVSSSLSRLGASQRWSSEICRLW